MEAEYDFLIYVNAKNKRFRMQVKKIYAGDSLDRYEVSAGDRKIVLQSNHPQLIRENSRKAIDWKLLEGDFSGSDPKQAAEGLAKIIDELEYKIKQQPPTIEEYIANRNK